MLSIIILSVLLLFAFPDEISSQQRILEMPSDFENPVSESSDHGPELVPGLAWNVFSDRNNNWTSKSPGGTANFKEMKFMEEFYVVEEKGEFVRIAKDPNPDGLDLSSDAEDFGWIHKSKMLLWSHCLVTERGKIPRKAMVLHGIRNIHDTERELSDIVEFKDSPGPDAGLMGESSHLFDFYFILKEENAEVLLSRRGTFQSNERYELLRDVIGWAPKSKLVFWNHRVAVEPNWDTKAVLERKNGQKALVLINEKEANRYNNGEKLREENILWNNDTFNGRQSGKWTRFPVVGEFNDIEHVIVTGVFGDVTIEDQTFTCYVEGATSLHVKGQIEPIFKRVILCSKDEFYDFIHSMRALAMRMNRKSLCDTWLELLRLYIGDISEDEIASMTIGKINEMVFNIPIKKDSFLTTVRLVDIIDEEILSDEEFFQYSKIILEKYQPLREIYEMSSEKYRYYFPSNELTYYWIDEDLLP